MPLWLAFPRMMENIVLPGAKRDSMTYLREMLANDRQLRQVIYMYRRQVKSLFRRIAGPQKRSAESGRRGSLLDVTPKDHITLRTFAQLIKESGAAMPSLCPWDGHALTLPVGRPCPHFAVGLGCAFTFPVERTLTCKNSRRQR